MELQLFADQCMPTVVIESLCSAGYEYMQLKDFLPIESLDSIVISKTLELDAILITLICAFAKILDYSPIDYQGILSLQIRNHPEILLQIVAQLKDYLSANPDMSHYQSKLFLVEAH